MRYSLRSYTSKNGIVLMSKQNMGILFCGAMDLINRERPDSSGRAWQCQRPEHFDGFCWQLGTETTLHLIANY